jgi:hypothetical protein
VEASEERTGRLCLATAAPETAGGGRGSRQRRLHHERVREQGRVVRATGARTERRES